MVPEVSWEWEHDKHTYTLWLILKAHFSSGKHIVHKVNLGQIGFGGLPHHSVMEHCIDDGVKTLMDTLQIVAAEEPPLSWDEEVGEVNRDWPTTA